MRCGFVRGSANPPADLPHGAARGCVGVESPCERLEFSAANGASWRAALSGRVTHGRAPEREKRIGLYDGRNDDIKCVGTVERMGI